MLRDIHAIPALLFALAIFATSLVLFLWAAKTTRSARLKLAFDPEAPGFVVQSGPYHYIRHPFYASYILFWLGCTVATVHPLMLIFLAGFGAINLIAALREERAFAASPFAEEYLHYRKTAGLLWPKLRAAEQQVTVLLRFGSKGDRILRPRLLYHESDIASCLRVHAPDADCHRPIRLRHAAKSVSVCSSVAGYRPRIDLPL